MEIEEIINAINAQKQAVLDGEVDPIQVYRKLKQVEKSISAALKEIFDSAYSECEKYDKRELAEMHIELRAGSRKWDYSNCSEWVILNKRIKDLEAELKARASLSQSELVDPDTGEVLSKPTYTVGSPSIIFK